MAFTEIHTPSSGPGLPYNFDAYPALHVDGFGGGAVWHFPDLPTGESDFAETTDYEITFSIAVTGSPQETSIYWGNVLPGAGTVYRRVSGTVQIDAEPVLTFRQNGYPQTIALWWTKHGVGADPSVSDFIRVTVTQIRAIVTLSAKIREVTIQASNSGTLSPQGTAQILSWLTFPALASDEEVAGPVTITTTFSVTGWEGMIGGPADGGGMHFDANGVWFDVNGGAITIDRRPQVVETFGTWARVYVVGINGGGSSVIGRTFSFSVTMVQRAPVRSTGAGSGGGAGGGGGASQVIGDGPSAAERILGLVTLDAVGLFGPPVDSGAPTPAQFPDEHWINGFEEGQIVASGTVDDNNGHWSLVQNIDGTGVTIVPGFHGASRYALRILGLVDNSIRAGYVKKDVPNAGTGTYYFRCYLRQDVLPTSVHPMMLWEANVGTPPFFVSLIQQETNGKLSIVSRAGGSATTVGAVQSGDRLEFRTTLGGSGSMELRVYTGDNTTPRETISVAGDPAPGGIEITTLQIGASTNAIHVDYRVDCVGYSKVDWLGPGTVLLAQPNRDIHAALARVGAGAGNYAVLDDYPATLDDTDWVQGSGGAFDRYGWKVLGAEFAGAGSTVKTLVVYMRGKNFGVVNVLNPLVWDESGRQFIGPDWAPGGMGNVHPQDQMVLNVQRRALGKLGLWHVGVSITPGADLAVSLLYGNLDVLEHA